MGKRDILTKVMWFDRRERFDLEHLYYLMQPQRKVSSDPRYKSGLFYSEKCGRDIQYESGLELSFFQFLESSPKVRFYFEQPARIPYRRGKKRLYYTPDVGIYLTSGEFVLAEVKELGAMIEDRVQCKTEGLIDFCSQKGFGLLVTDGKRTAADIKKIKLNRKLEKEIMAVLDQRVLRKREYSEIMKRCGASHNDLLRIIIKHDLFYTEFPFKLKHGGYNEVFMAVCIKGI